MKIERNPSEINLAYQTKNEPLKNEPLEYEKKQIDANSSEALNSYGRAMVNLVQHAKTNAPSNWQREFEPLSQEEKDEIEGELLELFQGDKKALDEFLGEDDIKERKLGIVKTFMDNSFIPLQAQYFLNGATKGNLDDRTYLNYINLLQEILVNDDYFRKDGYEDITKYIDKTDSETANRQIELIRAMLQKGSRKDYLVRIFNDVNNAPKEVFSNTMAFLAGLPDELTKEYLTVKLSQILLSADKETNATLTSAFEPLILDLAQEGKFYEATPLIDFDLSLEKPVNAKFLKELLEKEIAPKDIHSIIFFSNSDDENTNIKQRMFARELLRNEVSPDVVGRILSFSISDDVGVQENQISFARELLNSGMEQKDVARVLEKTYSQKEDENKRNIDLSKALLSCGVDSASIGPLLDELNNPHGPIKKYFIETMKKCDLNMFQIKNILKAISPMVELRE